MRERQYPLAILRRPDNMVLAFKYGVAASVKWHEPDLARRRALRLGGVRGALSTPLQSPAFIPRRKRRGPSRQTLERQSV